MRKTKLLHISVIVFDGTSWSARICFVGPDHPFHFASVRRNVTLLSDNFYPFLIGL